jgi:hypothetical protein
VPPKWQLFLCPLAPVQAVFHPVATDLKANLITALSFPKQPFHAKAVSPTGGAAEPSKRRLAVLAGPCHQVSNHHKPLTPPAAVTVTSKTTLHISIAPGFPRAIGIFYLFIPLESCPQSNRDILY